MKKLLGLLLCVPLLHATFTQKTNIFDNTNSVTSPHSVTITALTAHSAILLSTSTGTTGSTMTSITGGACNSAWTEQTQAALSVGASVLQGFYCLDTVGGATTITENFSGGSERIAIAGVEVAFTGRCVVPDPQTTMNANTTSNNPVGITLTLAGGNDAILQAAIQAGTISVSAGWTLTASDTRTSAYKINTTSGTAPTWTATGSSASKQNAMAISECTSKRVAERPSMGMILAEIFGLRRNAWFAAS